MVQQRLSDRPGDFHGQSVCMVTSTVMEIVTQGKKKNHSLVTLDNVRDSLVQFYCHGISDKLCIWHNIMLILGRASWRWNAYLLLMNVNLTELWEADTTVSLLQNKKDSREVVWVPATNEDWTEISLLEKETTGNPKKNTLWDNMVDFKSFPSRVGHVKFSKHWKEERNNH